MVEQGQAVARRRAVAHVRVVEDVVEVAAALDLAEHVLDDERLARRRHEREAARLSRRLVGDRGRDDHHGVPGVAHEVEGDAPEQRRRDQAASARSDHDHVGVALVGDRHDLGRGRPRAHDGLRVHAARLGQRAGRGGRRRMLRAGIEPSLGDGVVDGDAAQDGSGLASELDGGLDGRQRLLRSFGSDHDRLHRCTSRHCQATLPGRVPRPRSRRRRVRPSRSALGQRQAPAPAHDAPRLTKWSSSRLSSDSPSAGPGAASITIAGEFQRAYWSRSM